MFSITFPTKVDIRHRSVHSEIHSEYELLLFMSFGFDRMNT